MRSRFNDFKKVSMPQITLLCVQSTKYQPLPGSIIGENNDRELVRDFQVYTE